MTDTSECLSINILCPHCKQNTKAVLWMHKKIHIASCNNCSEDFFHEIKNNEFHIYKTNPYAPKSTEIECHNYNCLFNDENETLIDIKFVEAMERCFKAGIKEDRKANDWKEIALTDENIKKYFAKINRHAARAFLCDSYENGMPHLAAIACNANILWHMFNRGGR